MNRRPSDFRFPRRLLSAISRALAREIFSIQSIPCSRPPYNLELYISKISRARGHYHEELLRKRYA